ncbi:MAG: ABC transporter ATP-binding protein [Ruminococcaceae bacterium]|nr:ABC transporter ATP-binding protein [Oscillospiraceae bacterium]
MTKVKQTAPKGTWRRVLSYLKGYRIFLVLSLLLALVTVGLTLWVPVLIGKAIDLIISPNGVDFDGIFDIFKVAVAVIAATALMQWLMNVCNNKMTFGIVRNIRNDAFRHLQKVPFSYLDTKKTGDIVSRVIGDVDQFSDGLLLGLTQLFTGVATIVGTLLFMLFIHPGITLVVVLVTPVSLFVAAFIAKRTYRMFKRQNEIRGREMALMEEAISQHKVVDAFSQEKQMLARFDDLNEQLRDASLKATFFSSITNPSTRFVNSLVYTGVALTGALVAMSGGAAITIGELSCFLSYANQYTKPFNEISGVVTELQNALASAARIFEVLDAPVEAPDTEHATSLSAPRGEVEFCHVAFSYTDEQTLITDMNVKVAPGQHVAIVGPTGCGKTTVINLLMRFYDVRGGAILLDGVDIRHLTRKSLRASIGMVLQDTVLFSGTVRENIAFGKVNASDEEIINAAKAAHAHSFIKRLKNGYDTVIGEGGGTLSQGQKQLLCISRLMLCPPPILILDEATSSIDTRTEQRIQKAFATLMKGRTSFVVAHRLSTVRECDLILVMKDGNVIEQGTHDTLLAKNGFYKKLYESQFVKAK